MLIDTNKCAKGCTSLRHRLRNENGWGNANQRRAELQRQQKAQWIRKVDLRDTRHRFMSSRCR
jgi:tetrathionate reductase subunit B